jgi:hypothetical protein
VACLILTISVVRQLRSHYRSRGFDNWTWRSNISAGRLTPSDWTNSRRSWLELVPASVLLIASLGGVLVAALSPSGDRGQYAVVAPPWYNLTQAVGLVSSAGGDVVELGGFANVVIAHSENPQFVRALYRAGAWMVIDPLELKGCLGFAPAPPRMSGSV